MKKKLVICINREYGSGGRLMGQALSKQLGIPYYDDEILIKASEQSAVGEQYFRMNDEKPGNNLLTKIVGGLRGAQGKPTVGDHITSPDNLFRFQSEVIRELAEQESCILIGRCADFVLDSCGFEDHIDVFVYASLPAKVNRVMETDGIETKDALNRVQHLDKRRSEYYKYYTGESWNDMSRYDITVNTSDITIDQSCELIKTYLRLRGYDEI